MKTRRLLSLFAVAGFLMMAFASCDYVEAPYTEGGGTTTGGDSCGVTLDSAITPYKRVLLEDFTGHGCGNCPRAHEKANELSGIYGHDLVILGLHAGFFSDYTGIHGSHYTYNFQSQYAIDVDDYYSADNAGYPKGLINRIEDGGGALQEYADWSGLISTELNETPKAGLRVSSEFEASNNIADITVEVEYFEDSGTDDYLVVLISEDSILSWQKDYAASPQDIENYAHRHVVRSTVTTSTWGDLLCDKTISTGNQFKNEYSFTLDSEWDASHCYVVAYVMNGSTLEIYNVAEAKLGE